MKSAIYRYFDSKKNSGVKNPAKMLMKNRLSGGKYELVETVDEQLDR